MKLDKKLVLDFDYTIFDAKKFKNDLAQSMKCFGVSSNLFFKTYREVRFKNNQEFDYDPKKHLEIISQTVNHSCEKLSITFYSTLNNCPNYLYEDVIVFLENSKKNNHQIMLLTKGNIEFQKLKFKHCDIDRFFDNKFFTDTKKTYFKDRIADSPNTIFVNDRIDEILSLQKIYSQAQFYCICRSGFKPSNIRSKRVKWVHNLKQLEI
jgi:FMN phosphatase YigB (HAD superfamily)